TSATRDGDAHELRDWIADGVQAKRIISERVATELHGAALDLATRAGVSADAKPLLTAEQRAQVLADVTREAAAIIDLAGLERQAVAATRVADARPPTSVVWSVIGALQYVVTAALLFAGLWIAAVFFLHAPFASVDVPVLGPIPTPLVLLVSLLVAGYVLARLLGAHA